MAARRACPGAPFIFCSTNKVYGDRPNSLPLVELERRWEIEPGHRYQDGIDESMSIDDCKHSLFGASKVAADVLVQEYGKYFGMPTAVFRGGRIWCTHSGSLPAKPTSFVNRNAAFWYCLNPAAMLGLAQAMGDLSRRVAALIRRADVVARFGGEEFVIMLPEIDKQAGALVAEKIRAKIAQYPFHGRDRQPGGELTVTIGLATYPIDSDNGLELVDVADRALYVGKRQGGNRVVLSSERSQTPLQLT